MSYAQTNYLQPIGIAPTKYTIAATGCFLTAFANLLTDRFSKPIDPVGLNAVFRDRGIYIDVDDGVRDDLAWSSVTAFDGSVTVVQTGSGAPTNDNSIVKFIYKSPRTGQTTTHFSIVASAARGTIIDSWDGKEKSWNVYGGPKAYATYANSNPQPIQPIAAPSPAANTGKLLFLPASAGQWRIYNVGGPYGVGHEIAKLWPGNPEWAPGLTYEILGTIAPNIYKIRTESKGEVAIYAGPDTVAQFKDKPAPAPEPVPVPATTTVSPPAAEATVTVTPQPVHVEVAEPTPSISEEVPVVPVDWHTVDTAKAGVYRAKADITINDADGLQVPVIMHKDDRVTLAGTFKPKDIEYGISVKSVKNKTWYAIPLENLDPIKTDAEQEEALDKVLDELFGKQDSEEAQKPIELPASKNTIRNALSKFFGYLAGIGDRYKNKNKELVK